MSIASILPMCLLMALLVLSIACSEASSAAYSPFAPTPPVVALPPAAPVVRDGVPLEIGQTINGTLTSSDLSCGVELGLDAPEPCQLFVLVVQERGFVTVQLTTPDAGPLSLRVNQTRKWGQALSVTIEVREGFRYEIGVALHDGPHAASQRFELTTSFEAD